MADPHSAPSAGRFEVRVTSDSHFGWIRTRLSIERTMMSWIRTAVALIGFGFAIVQFFERLGQMPGARPAAYPDAARDLGLGPFTVLYPFQANSHRDHLALLVKLLRPTHRSWGVGHRFC